VLVAGASRGIGRAVVGSLVEERWNVFAGVRSFPVPKPVQGATYLSLDVRSEVDVRQAFDYITESTNGSLDAVVYNAGLAVGGAFEDLPSNSFYDVMETNFFGCLSVVRHALPLIRKSLSGRIVLMSSEGALFGAPGLSAYIASKWALEGWAESLLHEINRWGIRITCVEPGPTDTDLWSAARWEPEDSDYSDLAGSVESYIERRLRLRTTMSPGAVGKEVSRILTMRHPPFRKPIGRMAVFLSLAKKFATMPLTEMTIRAALSKRKP
jgi:NAD(P)-dependent dehydrogenase (short-subunit alcohol dehydrogenase family)